MRTIYVILLSLFSILLFAAPAKSQAVQYSKDIFGGMGIPTPNVAIKTNLLYDLTTSINLGVEVKTGNQYSLDVSASYNPWNFSNRRKVKHFFVQPEFRYWFCEAFNGHFLGVHGLYGQYNIAGSGRGIGIGIPFLNKETFENRRHQGDMIGGGISYGYQWYLSPRLNLELTIGAGYLYFNYKIYECQTCGKEIDHRHKHYFGPTKLGISLMYIL